MFFLYTTFSINNEKKKEKEKGQELFTNVYIFISLINLPSYKKKCLYKQGFLISLMSFMLFGL